LEGGNMKNKIFVFMACFMMIVSIGFARVGVSLDTFYTLPGVSLNFSNYEINNAYSNYFSVGVGFPYGKVEMGQLWKMGGSPFRVGLVEGAESSFIIQGYYFGPALQYDISNNVTFRVYGGAMYANSPFGDAIGTAIINGITGGTENFNSGYQWIGMGGVSLTGYF